MEVKMVPIEVLVYSDSEGCKKEAEYARRTGKPVIYRGGNKDAAWATTETDPIKSSRR